MNRPRVAKKWAKAIGLSPLQFTFRQHDYLQYEEELSTSDMRRWILREIDCADYKYWMPHKIVQLGEIVRVYYMWVGHEPVQVDLVLVVGRGKCILDTWEGSKLVSSKLASTTGVTNVAQPSITDRLRIGEYLSKYEVKK